MSPWAFGLTLRRPPALASRRSQSGHSKLSFQAPALRAFVRSAQRASFPVREHLLSQSSCSSFTPSSNDSFKNSLARLTVFRVCESVDGRGSLQLPCHEIGPSVAQGAPHYVVQTDPIDFNTACIYRYDNGP